MIGKPISYITYLGNCLGKFGGFSRRRVRSDGTTKALTKACVMLKYIKGTERNILRLPLFILENLYKTKQ